MCYMRDALYWLEISMIRRIEGLRAILGWMRVSGQEGCVGVVLNVVSARSTIEFGGAERVTCLLL